MRQRSEHEAAWYPQERLSRQAALHAYTRGACDSLGWQRAGRLEVGALVDFCVIDRNHLECAWPAQVRVLRTVISGKSSIFS